MAVFTNDLRLTELATGEGSGTWGTTTNTNLSLLAESFSFGTEAITTNADTHTTTIADGATDPGRSLFLKYTGTLDSACTITIGPNTVSKLWLIQNSTSGGFSIIIKQGSGATVTVPNGQTKAIYSDGAGSGGAMVDAFAHLNVVDLTVEDDLTITDDLTVNGDLDLEGSIDVNGTANLDAVDIDGALTQDGGAVFNEASADVDFRIESNGQENMFFVDGGDDAVVIGNNSSRKTLFNTTATAAFQIEGTSGNTAAMSIARNSNDDNGPQFVLAKSNGTSAGAVTVVTDDALLGRISFQGADGTQTVEGARVEAFVSGTPGANDMPGRLVFSTTQDGSATPTERWRIDSVGNLTSGGNAANGIGGTPSDANFAELGAGFLNLNRDDTADASQIQFGKNGIAHSHIQTSASGLLVGSLGNMNTFVNAGTSGSNVLDLQTGGTTRMRVSNQAVIVNEDGSSGIDFRVESDNNANMLLVDAGNDFVGIGNTTQWGGVLNVTSSDNGNTLVLACTDTDASVGPILSLYRSSSSSAADNDEIGIINVQGLNDANQAITYASLGSLIEDATDGHEDGMFILKTMVAGTSRSRMAVTTASGTVFNEDSIDLDFRVESDGNTHMLFVDAGNNHVNIGTSTDHTAVLNVESTDNNYTLMLASTDSDANAGPWLGFDRVSSSPAADDNIGSMAFLGRDSAGSQTQYAEIRSYIQDPTNGSEDGRLRFIINNAGTQRSVLDISGSNAIVFNEDGQDLDFRVESGTGNANMLFVDAGNEVVNIGGTTVEAGDTFSIHGSGTNTIARMYNTNAGGDGSIFIFQKASSSPADQDVLGDIRFHGNDDGGTMTQFARIRGVSADVTNGTEDGEMHFEVVHNGTTREVLQLGSSIVFNEAGQDIDFRVESTASSHMLYVDASTSRVGVGVASPTKTFDLQSSAQNAARIRGSANVNMYSYGDSGGVGWATGENTSYGELLYLNESDSKIQFYANQLAIGDFGSSEVNFNDRSGDQDFRVETDANANGFKVDAGANAVFIGTGSTISAGSEGIELRADFGFAQFARNNTGNVGHILFFNPNGEVGSISTSSSSTLYNTSSDQRLKDNIQDAEDAGELIDAIQVRQFNWKADGLHQSYGMIAQELNTVAPEAVSIPEDPDEMMSVDYSKLVPMLVKEIQSLRNRVAELEGE